MNNMASNAEKIYTASVVLAMGLLFYANADAQEAPDGTVVQLGIGKSFYVPCAIALISSFYIPKIKDKLDIRLNWLIVVALMSSIFHFPFGNNPLIWTVTRFIFAILCFKDVRNINPYLFAKYMALLSPIIIFPHYILTNPFAYGDWRYGGFYGDANFLAMALNFVIAMCYIACKKEKKKYLLAIYISSIIGAIPLIMLGLSRGGLLGLGIVLFFILDNLRRKNTKWFYAVLLVCALGSGKFITRFDSTIQGIELRFSGNSSSDANGAKARLDGIESSLNVLSNKPYLIPFGIGLGNTYPMMSEYSKDGYFCKVNIHNTFFSLLYELGLIGVILYTSIYVHSFKKLYRHRNYLLIGVLASAVLSLLTLPGAAFMPGWILLFFTANKFLDKISDKKI